MPHFGFYEWFCIVVLVAPVLFSLIYLMTGGIQKDITKFRKMWHNADPRDNHRDR